MPSGWMIKSRSCVEEMDKANANRKDFAQVIDILGGGETDKIPKNIYKTKS